MNFILVLTLHLLSSDTDHHLFFSCIKYPDSESFNTAIFTAVLCGASAINQINYVQYQ